MTTNANLLEAILRQSGKPLSRMRLLKIAYMADLLAWRVLGRPISRFNYHRYHHGPFDQEFYCALEELLSLGRARIDEVTTKEGHDCQLVYLVADAPPVRPEVFTRGDVHLIGLAVQKYRDLPLQTFLVLVYETEPMKEARLNQPLPMEAQRNKDRDQAGGISLEIILESREAFVRGESISHESLKREIFGGSQ
jgi:hypothetical protein